MSHYTDSGRSKGNYESDISLELFNLVDIYSYLSIAWKERGYWGVQEIHKTICVCL